MALDVVVRTVHGNLDVKGLPADTDVGSLKSLLYQQGQQEHVPIPLSSKQRLVSRG